MRAKRKLMAVGMAIGLATVSVQAAATNFVWDAGGGVDNNWTNNLNWNPDGAPNGNNSDTATIDVSGAVVNVSKKAVVIRTLNVSGTGTAPVLNISTNLSNPYTSMFVGSTTNVLNSGYNGVVNQTAGTVTVGNGGTSYRLYIGARLTNNISSGYANNSGTYNLSGGTLNVSNFTAVGRFSGESGKLAISGNAAFTTPILQLAHYAGTGTLSVVGGQASINLLTNLLLSAYGSGVTGGAGTSIIDFTIDVTGASKINVGNNVQFDVTGSSSNNTLFQLSLGSGFVYSNNTTYTIIDATGDFTGFGQFGNVTNNQVLTVDGKQFTANYVTGAGINDKFTLTTIPEPATIGILGFGALLTLVLRRLKM